MRGRCFGAGAALWLSLVSSSALALFSVPVFDIATAGFDSSNWFQPDEAFHGDIGNRWDDAVHDMVVQADGRIAVTGYYTNARGLAGIYLQRLMPDGSRDTSFNTYGTLWIPNKQVALFVPLSIIQQTDGKLVITGYKRTPYGLKSLLMRFNPDGSFDNTFGKRGKRLLQLGRASVLSDIVQQPDGKLVAVGSVLPGGLSVTTLVVARFLSDGKPDKTFGDKGRIFIASASGDAAGYSLLLQDDGRIVVTGSTEDGSTLSSLLVRLSPSGQLDSSFGNGGGTLTSMSPYADETYKVIEQMDGKLLAVGYASTSLNGVVENRDLAVARYTADGQPDTGFGTGGVSVIGVDPLAVTNMGHDEATDALQLPNGQLLLGGVVKGGMGFMVLEADGQPAGGDASGAAHNAGFSGAVLANAIGLQPDGKVLLAGYRRQLDQHEGKYYNDSVVVRFHGGDVDGDGAPDVLDPYPLDSDNDGVNNTDEALP